MKKIILIIILVSSLFLCVDFARAGFGISPPRIRNEHLIPGVTLEKTIYLVQRDSDNAITVNVEIIAEEIRDWIEVEAGKEFEIPKDVNQFPMKVKITVPSDAKLGKYKGVITLKISPRNIEPSSGVANTSLGAEVNIDLKVGDSAYESFLINNLSVANTETGSSVPLFIEVNNKGNTAIKIDKVEVEIFDNLFRTLLESFDENKIKEIPPFVATKINFDFPVNLEIGEYWLSTKIYRGKEMIKKERMIFEITPKIMAGEVKSEEVFGYIDSVKNKNNSMYLKWIFLIVLTIVLIGSLYLTIKKSGISLEIKINNLKK